MKSILIFLISTVLLLFCINACSSQVLEPANKLRIEGPWDYITQAGLSKLGLNNNDAPFPFIRKGNDDYWIYFSEGGATDGKHSHIIRLRTTISSPDMTSLENIPISGIPDANVNNYNGWKAWLMNLHPINSEEWLAVLHFEDQDARSKECYRMGIAYSADNAKTFKLLGFTLEADLPDSIVKKGNVIGGVNIAGAGIRSDETYLYVYFHENSDLNKDNQTKGYVAVARANLNELISNARKGENTLWYKYYNGAWNEPGLGGHSANIGTLGEYHTTLMYNAYVKKWILVNTQNGAISLKMSEDPLNFNVPDQLIYKIPAGYRVAYCSIQPNQEDMTQCGKEFYIYYRIWNTTDKPTKYDTQRLKVIL